MPLELQIIRAAEFVRLGAEGYFDLAASKAALAKLAGACRKRGIDRALMDLRDLQPGPKPVFSPADLVTLVNTFREIGFTKRQRLAVLYRTDPHRRARLFAFVGTMRGWNVQAFDDFEESLHWLSGGPEEESKPARAGAARRVPVRTTGKESPAATLPVKVVKASHQPKVAGRKKTATPVAGKQLPPFVSRTSQQLQEQPGRSATVTGRR